jgi:hypothetical protein
MGALDGLVDSIISAAAADAPSSFAVGTVVAVGEGSADDGNSLVTVSWRGGQYRCVYLQPYEPAIDDVVLMARTQPLAILGRIVGTPPVN